MVSKKEKFRRAAEKNKETKFLYYTKDKYLEYLSKKLPELCSVNDIFSSGIFFSNDEIYKSIMGNFLILRPKTFKARFRLFLRNDVISEISRFFYKDGKFVLITDYLKSVENVYIERNQDMKNAVMNNTIFPEISLSFYRESDVLNNKKIDNNISLPKIEGMISFQREKDIHEIPQEKINFLEDVPYIPVVISGKHHIIKTLGLCGLHFLCTGETYRVNLEYRYGTPPLFEYFSSFDDARKFFQSALEIVKMGKNDF